jgi:hypothetical protein
MPLLPDPSHREYILMLRRMTPQQRLAKAFELTENGRRLFLAGLRKRFPHLSEEELRKLYLQRLHLCHNRNY